jgi:hypothetical protein
MKDLEAEVVGCVGGANDDVAGEESVPAGDDVSGHASS